MKKSRISIEEAQEILSPYHSTIHACFEHAWDRWKTSWQPLIPSGLPRDRRSAMSSLIDEQIRTRLGAEDGIEVRELGQRVLAYVQDRIILFNKFFADAKLTTSNNPTARSKAWDQNEVLPGIEDFDRIKVGYRLNPLETELSGVWISALGSGAWSYQIGHEERRNEVLSFPTPIQPTRRITPKRIDTPKTGSDDGEGGSGE